MKSQRFTLNGKDITQWSRNAAIFFAPALLACLLVLQSGGTQEEALMALKMWGLNTSIDLLRKFLSGK